MMMSCFSTLMICLIVSWWYLRELELFLWHDGHESAKIWRGLLNVTALVYLWRSVQTNINTKNILPSYRFCWSWSVLDPLAQKDGSVREKTWLDNKTNEITINAHMEKYLHILWSDGIKLNCFTRKKLQPWEHCPNCEVWRWQHHGVGWFAPGAAELHILKKKKSLCKNIEATSKDIIRKLKLEHRGLFKCTKTLSRLMNQLQSG